MKLLLHAVLLLVATRGALNEDETIQEDSNVLKLTLDNFDNVIGENAVILVEFFAPWCGHCKRLAPEYEAAAKELADATPPVPLATVDATEETQLAARFAIDGYPTLKVFHNGVAYDYEGPRIANGIVEYMKKEARPDWAPPTDPVLVLTESNFTDTVNSSPLILVEFYAPWCGHCKKLAPEYSKAGRDLLEHDIPLAKVDATAESALAKQFDVTGYPTMKLFRSGKPYDYSGPRERFGIVQYMLKQAEPASMLIETNKQLDQFLKSNQQPVVVTFAPSQEDSLYSGHDSVANVGRETPLTFAHCFITELAHHYGITEHGTVIFTSDLFVSTYEPAVKRFEGDMTADSNATAVLEELMTSARPLVGLRMKATEEWYPYPRLVAYLEVDTSKEGVEEFTYWRSQLLPLAREYSGRLTVVLADEREYVEELQQLELDDWGEDVAMAIWADSKRKYPLKVDFDDLEEIVEDYFSGKLRPILRSQAKPRKNDGPLTVVVGSTFEEIVLNSGKDVFIEFYAPWCGHCKALEPKYKKLAKKFKKNDNLVIAKFDATANDAPSQFEFTGFPTLFFVSANNDITVYSGGREVEDMTSYLKKMSKKKKKTNKDEL